MVSIQINGYITGDGELKLDLPAGLPVGRVQVTIETAAEGPTFTPRSGADIVAMLEETGGWWTDEDISDGVTWLEEVRRRESDKRNIQW